MHSDDDFLSSLLLFLPLTLEMFAGRLHLSAHAWLYHPKIFFCEDGDRGQKDVSDTKDKNKKVNTPFRQNKQSSQLIFIEVFTQIVMF